jgi:demethylmenaquinone methyltransferase/2-methoxy-6-polyprenyl-1,4-benzoquinol methylase
VSSTERPTRESGEFASQVNRMFDRIAGHYDAMNSVMTAGLHHRWRQRAAARAELCEGDSALDVCCGTGDLALELARQVGSTGSVVGCDFSEQMLDLARAKAAQRGATAVRFEWADALRLPYDDASFDAATVGFGARNFSDLRQGLREMVRVVRPGGRVVVLEMTTPTRPPLSLFYRLWFDRLVPLIGKLAGSIARLVSRPSGSPSETTIAQAYTYLPNSVKRFHPPDALVAEMERVGCSDIGYVLMAGGIIAVHGATVPEGGSREHMSSREI